MTRHQFGHLNPAEMHALELLATARYPAEHPLMAIDMLLSDRRTAGLGALDEPKRERNRRQSRIRNFKHVDPTTGRVHYSMLRDTRMERVWNDDFTKYQLVPSRLLWEKCQFLPIDFLTQAGRCHVAGVLRNWRRKYCRRFNLPAPEREA
jgi:hypothetical protein